MIRNEMNFVIGLQGNGGGWFFAPSDHLLARCHQYTVARLNRQAERPLLAQAV